MILKAICFINVSSHKDGCKAGYSMDSDDMADKLGKLGRMGKMDTDNVVFFDDVFRNCRNHNRNHHPCNLDIHHIDRNFALCSSFLFRYRLCDLPIGMLNTCLGGLY
jgi:hypothetical protein